MSSVLIVGAGHAGSQLAVSLRQEGFDGPITLIGAEAETPYHRPPLSKAFLKADESKLQPLRAESFYAANTIDFRPVTIARAIDPARGRCETDGSTIGFDTLVLATGATPRLPDIDGIGVHGVFALRSADDARRIRAGMPAARDVVVIGGGFIGLEIAATMAAFGKTVTVLEIGDRLLARAVSPVVSAHILSTLTTSGIAVRLGMAASAVTGSDRVSGVETTSGEHIAADLVLIGIGAEPNVGLAENAGLRVDGGIVVDEAMRSSNPAILAIGDCTRFHHWQAARSVRLESVQNATDQARHAARTILGRAEPFRA
ncbi:NAD(P)/FAD-dependent oxidoreductase, partial [Rhizobiaceae sp. 2RAB30]